MALRYGFYNSYNGDRKYNAEDMGNLLDGIITDGVFANVDGIFGTIAGEGLQVIVKTGRAWFDGTWSINDALIPLTIETPDVVLDRYDAVVLETNHATTERKNSIKIVKGNITQGGTWPSLINNALIKQHPLAYIKVRANTTQILASDIDIRVGKSDCPFVTGILTTVSIDDLFNAWQADFDAWFENIQTVISTDTVTNLQRQIDLKLNKADKATAAMVASGTNDTYYVTPKSLKSTVSNASNVVKEEVNQNHISVYSLMDAGYIHQFDKMGLPNINVSSMIYPVSPSNGNEILATRFVNVDTSTYAYNMFNVNISTGNATNRAQICSFSASSLSNTTPTISAPTFINNDYCCGTDIILSTSPTVGGTLIDKQTFEIIYAGKVMPSGTKNITGGVYFSLNGGRYIYIAKDYYIRYDPNDTNQSLTYYVYPKPFSEKTYYTFIARKDTVILGETTPGTLILARINSNFRLYFDRVILGASSATVTEEIYSSTFKQTYGSEQIILTYNGQTSRHFAFGCYRLSKTTSSGTKTSATKYQFLYNFITNDWDAFVSGVDNNHYIYTNDQASYPLKTNTSSYLSALIGSTYLDDNRIAYLFSNGHLVIENVTNGAYDNLNYTLWHPLTNFIPFDMQYSYNIAPINKNKYSRIIYGPNAVYRISSVDNKFLIEQLDPSYYMKTNITFSINHADTLLKAYGSTLTITNHVSGYNMVPFGFDNENNVLICLKSSSFYAGTRIHAIEKLVKGNEYA